MASPRLRNEETRTAQTDLRLSSLDLTMNVHPDPEMLDVAAAMNALPALATGRAERCDTMNA